MGKATIEEFIQKAKLIHNDKYDYSKVEYVNNKTKVCIICPEHGEFWQEPRHHLSNHGCPFCGKKSSDEKQKHTLEEFIERSNKIHNYAYSYEKAKYVNSDSKLCIICPTHGEFWQTPHSHMKGRGCPKCGRNRNVDSVKLTKEYFINQSKLIHNNKYDYSNVKYVNTTTKVCINCPIHGNFWQKPNSHLQGHGCAKCSSLNKANDTIDFVKRSNNIHNYKYDYSCTNYINNQTKVCIICPEHGKFWQRPDNHLKGQSCPKCNSSHMENEIRNLLSSHNIRFEEQKRFEWLGKQSLDFYLPDHKTAIECQGIQHFEPITYFGSYESFKTIQENDIHKRQICEENEIMMLYYANYEYEFPYEVITNTDKLLKMLSYISK